MKKILLLCCSLAIVLGALGGCEAVTDRVRQKFTPAPPETRTYKADQRAVYEAARNALDGMGFRVLRGGPAQGKIDAVNSVQTDDALRGARQVAVKVRLEPTLDGGTEMRVWITEIVEDNYHSGAGMGTEMPMHNTPLYEVLFRRVGRALGEPEKS